MVHSFMILKALTVAVLAVAVNAVYEGFEQYGNLQGKFWVSCSAGITILDPVIGVVVKNLSCPTTKWGDSAYIRDQAQIKHYVFSNDNANNKVLVFDASTQNLLTTVQLSSGSSPLHMYAIYYYDQVWTHEDGTGSFDVFRTAEVRYRESGGVRASTFQAGHGKLLANPNLQDTGFATNVKSGAIYKINIATRQYLTTVNLTSDKVTTQGLSCSGTHGIDYSPVNDRIYVECSNPSKCTTATNNNTCTGSVWGVDAVSLKVKARLTSPYLSELYGANFGLQGQVVHSPEYTFLIVANSKLNIIHFLKPTNTTTLVLDMPLTGPGSTKFYPKNPDITFGHDRNASNYWACVPVPTGIAFIDMALIVEAFAAGKNFLPSSTASIVTYNNGGSARTIGRGGDYLIGASYSSSSVTNGLALINVKTKKVSYLYGVAIGASKFLYVPTHTDEVQYTVAQLSSQLDETTGDVTNITSAVTSLQSQITVLQNSDPTSYEKDTRSIANTGRGIAIAAIIVSSVAIVLSTIAIYRGKSPAQARDPVLISTGAM